MERFFSAVGIAPLQLTGKNGWMTCTAYVGASAINAAKNAGFPSAFCRKDKFSGKWTLGVRTEEIEEPAEREDFDRDFAVRQ